ncbi:hypothetical protein ACI2KS_24260, partial [Pseudomonas sp. NPDC087358]|uniref:hypothetical protein n=1 Tax=Pseudomonas sp. NPDC087358 TaxID=3364439 RepID=UPI00384F235B
TEWPDSTAGARQIAGKPSSHGLRPESKAGGAGEVIASARRAWESGLPTIWREAPANPVHAIPLTHRIA